MKSVLTVIGTRPEAIKLAPVLRVIHKCENFESKVCVTRQHTDLLDPFLLNLGITIHYQFEGCKTGESLHHSAGYILEKFGEVLAKEKPNLVIVQGDTTTAFSAALAAFYARIPVAHVEAGLRTGHFYSPWPEEVHRCLIDRLATYFFAPTRQAQAALLAEGIPSARIWVVGNTSIDAVRLARKSFEKLIGNPKQRVIVVTVHRRENHGDPLKEICHALRMIADGFPDVRIVVFLHPNPAVCNPIAGTLSGVANIDLMDPIDHCSFIRLLDESVFVMTDSGGIQEELPFMGKPVLIMRDTTERPEGVQAGTARLVGTKSDDIIACCKELLENPELLTNMSKTHFPYGDGYAAERIVTILERELKGADS
jgi:UDP-N-acetylglucosamine 2-epimerase (non-hydrolysing)